MLTLNEIIQDAKDMNTIIEKYLKEDWQLLLAEVKGKIESAQTWKAEKIKTDGLDMLEHLFLSIQLAELVRTSLNLRIDFVEQNGIKFNMDIH